jgi:Flp pilus assembly protein TadD
MKRFWLLVGAILLMATPLRAAEDPADKFLQAFFQIQEAERSAKRDDYTRALARFENALQILNEIRATNPGWNPHIIEYRLKYCADNIAELQRQQMMAAPPVPPARPPAPAPTPEPEAEFPEEVAAPTIEPTEFSEEINRLNAEIARLRAQITELDAAKKEADARLQRALAQVSPTETTIQLETYMRENTQLSARLAEAQTQIRELRAQLDDATPARVRQLEEELAATRQELAATKAQLAEARRELADTNARLEVALADNAKLKSEYQDLLMELNDARTRLRASAQLTDEQRETIALLEKENALLRDTIEQKIAAPAERWPATAELRGFRRRRPPPEPKRAAPKVEVAVAPEPKRAAPPRDERTTERIPYGTLHVELTAPPPREAPAAPSPEEIAKAKAAALEQAVSQPSPADELVRGLLADARNAFGARDFETAALKYQHVLEVDSTNLVALSNLGVVRFHQNRLLDAQNLFQRAAKVAPNDAYVRSVLGIVYFKAGKYDDAFAELTRAVALNPRNAEAHNYLGITLSQKGWTAAAEQALRKAIELNPNYADAHFNLAVMYARQRPPHFELARYHYRKALELGAEPDREMDKLLQAAQPARPAPQTLPAEGAFP